MNISVAANGGAVTVACSDTALANEAACNEAVDNCQQTYCHKSGANAATKGCRLCNVGFVPQPVKLDNVGHATCRAEAQGGEIQNCDVYDPVTPANCMVCATNFVVKWNDATACVAFNNDQNCRVSGNFWAAYCGECKNGYYFSSGTCTIGYQTTANTTHSGIIWTFTALSVALLFFFN